MNDILYACIVALTVPAFVIARRGFTGPRSWFAMLLVLNSPTYLISYPMALLGFPTHEWLLDSPSTTLFLSIVAVSLAASWVACELCLRQRDLPKFLRNVPVSVIEEQMAIKIIYGITASGAILSLILSMSGYLGYFMKEELITAPPAWLDFVRGILAVSGGLLFLIYLSEFRIRKILSVSAWCVAALWSVTGVFAGLKTFIVMPFLLIIIAGWLMRRLRMIQFVALAFAIWFAYSVVEPMREAKNEEISNTALGAFEYVVSSNGISLSDPSDVLESFLNRVDLSKEAIRSLEVDQFGLMDIYNSRLEETYRLAPLLAVVPRTVWPDKPLATLGQDLSEALDEGIGTNSLTPSSPVASYLWAGFWGVTINSILGTFFTMMGGRLLYRYVSKPVAYFPMLLLAIVCSIKEDIMAYAYINIFRVSLVLALLYGVGSFIGLFRKPQPDDIIPV